MASATSAKKEKAETTFSDLKGIVCNRYRLTHSQVALAKWFGASGEFDDAPRYNIAPTQPALTVRREHGEKVRRFTTMRWGLIPHWAKDMSIGTRTLNARSETVTKLPAFRDAILTKRWNPYGRRFPHLWHEALSSNSVRSVGNAVKDGCDVIQKASTNRAFSGSPDTSLNLRSNVSLHPRR